MSLKIHQIVCNYWIIFGNPHLHNRLQFLKKCNTSWIEGGGIKLKKHPVPTAGEILSAATIIIALLGATKMTRRQSSGGGSLLVLGGRLVVHRQKWALPGSTMVTRDNRSTTRPDRTYPLLLLRRPAPRGDGYWFEKVGMYVCVCVPETWQVPSKAAGPLPVITTPRA